MVVGSVKFHGVDIVQINYVSTALLLYLGCQLPTVCNKVRPCPEPLSFGLNPSRKMEVSMKAL